MHVLIFGTFDSLHPGHLFVFDEAKKRGDTTVIVARDENVQRLKNHTPKQNEIERQNAVRDAFPEATVILGDQEDFFAPVRALNPDLVLLGYDQKLPPGVEEGDFLCPIERLPAFEPEKYKSSLRNT